MRDACTLFVVHLPSTACVGVSGWLAREGNGTWGWFLLCAVLLSATRNDIAAALRK
jgi:hypothetical protein